MFLLLVVGILAGSLIYSLTSLNLIVGEEDVELKISRGDTWSKVGEEIRQQSAIRYPVLILWAAKILRYEDSIRSGRYLLKSGNTAFDIIKKLRSGRQDPIRLVLNNITFAEDLTSKVAKETDIDAYEFLSYLQQEGNAERYGFTTENFISMFLCNTYEIYWDIGLQAFVDRMYQEYKRFWDVDRLAKAERIGLDPDEVIILASIVQRETNHRPEYGKVASVYLNRLKRGMPLQADPTVKFALKDFAIKRILKKDLEVDSPYNTYKYKNLPPGPIGLPELDVIDGVLNAEDTSFLYFCAIYGQGKHAFSSSYSEHLRNARAYHSALNQQKIFR